MLVKNCPKRFFWLRTHYVWVMFFFEIYWITITQHAHIYSFHTSNFKFVGFLSNFFINIAPNFTNRYRRKTRLVHSGIVNLAGTPFSLKRGASALFLMHHSPLFEEYRNSRRIVQKQSSRQISAGQKNVSKYQPDTNRPVLVIYQYRPDGQYWDGKQHK
jgi:hypothetical protein